MSYLLFGIVLIAVGVVLFGIGANITMMTYFQANQTAENPLDYLQILESSSYPVGLGLLALGGGILFWGASSIGKYRKGNYNS